MAREEFFLPFTALLKRLGTFCRSFTICGNTSKRQRSGTGQATGCGTDFKFPPLVVEDWICGWIWAPLPPEHSPSTDTGRAGGLLGVSKMFHLWWAEKSVSVILNSLQIHYITVVLPLKRVFSPCQSSEITTALPGPSLLLSPN